MTDLNEHQLRRDARLAAIMAAANRPPTRKPKPANRVNPAAASRADDVIPPAAAAVIPPAQRPSAPPPRAAAPTVPAGPYTGSGNTLPAFTASGLDPKVLLRYPAPVRPALAALPTLAEAYHVGQSYLGLTDDQARQQLATDTRIPTEYAYAWTDATYIEPGGIGAPSDYQPDAAIARNNQARLDHQARERARMKAEAESRGDFFTYRNY